MARQLSAKKPKHLGYTLRTLLSYLGRHKLLLLAVAVLVSVSALANLLGTYMIRPVVNSLAGGQVGDLIRGVAVTAGIYGLGAVCAYGYTQIMVKAAQKVLRDIRRDLFAHLQTLPLRFFDTRRHGDVMSYFTNDVDTISDALNNSFAMVIQSFIQVAGTLTMLFILNWQLSLVVAVCYVVMFGYVRFSGKRSKAYYTKQQASLGELDGYIEEMMAGQKVVKVFSHEGASLAAFREKNEALRRAGTGAQGYAATMVPAVVAISYINYAIVSVLGGIMAIRQGRTHAAGCHLLNEADGTYNTAYLKKYFPNGGVYQVECVGRTQGLMVAPGNPLGLSGFRDIVRPGLRYVNRQKGSGTRILADYLCKQENVDRSQIYGYDREEFTHTSVAAQIASGTADAGMGIWSAARLYGLDFLPVCVEQYDLLIPDYAWDTPMVRRLLETLASPEFRTRLEGLGGYTLDHPGQVRRHF